MEQNKPTNGEQIACAVLPFMFSKHTLTREEAIGMIEQPVNRIEAGYKAKIKSLEDAREELLAELKRTEDLLINLALANPIYNRRLARVREVIFNHTPKQEVKQ